MEGTCRHLAVFSSCAFGKLVLHSLGSLSTIIDGICRGLEDGRTLGSPDTNELCTMLSENPSSRFQSGSVLARPSRALLQDIDFKEASLCSSRQTRYRGTVVCCLVCVPMDAAPDALGPFHNLAPLSLKAACCTLQRTLLLPPAPQHGVSQPSSGGVWQRVR